MSYGYRFPAEFVNKTSAEIYFTWSAGQALVYNAKVEEACYHYRFAQVFGGKMPNADQKYSHLITNPYTKKRYLEWLESVPPQVLRIGAVLYYKAVRQAKVGLAKRPKTKRIKAADRHLWLTSDLFSIRQLRDKWFELTLWVKEQQVARIRFKAHRPFEMPNSVHIKTKGSRLFVSFCSPKASDEDRYPETEDEIRARLRMKTPEELLERTVGCDRGVVTPLQTQTQGFWLTRTQKARMRHKGKRIKKCQKKLARQVLHSSGWRKTRIKINDANTYGRNVRENLAHQTSHALVSLPNVDVIAFEDLKVEAMMAAPKPKFNEAGKSQHNGRAAKAGLNRAIQFEAAWGRTLAYTQYKALKHGKLVVTVPAAYSSQQCPKCGHTHRSNRPDQAHFACTNPDCRFNEDHQLTADQVAAMNIAARAVKQIFDDQQKSKERTRLLRMRKKGESKGQGRGGTPRTVMRSGNVGAAKPVEPMPDTGNLPVSTLAVKPESLDKRVALAGECSSTSL